MSFDENDQPIEGFWWVYDPKEFKDVKSYSFMYFSEV